MKRFFIFKEHRRKGILPTESSTLGLSLLPIIVIGLPR